MLLILRTSNQIIEFTVFTLSPCKLYTDTTPYMQAEKGKGKGIHPQKSPQKCFPTLSKQFQVHV